MGIASRDENRVTTLLGVSSSDGITPVTLYADPTTHRLLTSPAGGSAPADATYVTLSLNASLSDERVLTGTANQIIITDNGAGSTVVLSLPQSIATSSTPTFASLTLTGASSLTLGTSSSNAGSIILKNATNANTATIVSGVTSASYSVTWPTAQGGASTVLTNDGAGALSWSANGNGTVTDVSVVSANGFAGSVATSTTTPAITLTTTITGILSGNGTAISAASTTGSGAVVLANTPTLITPVLGVATATSINGLTITSSTGTLTITNAKTFSVLKTLTLDGTDGTTMTFPTTSATIARTDAGNTFTGSSTASAWVLTSPTITTSIVPTSNDGAALGSTTNQFSDLFLAEGGVINWDNGDATLTQVGNVVTLAGAALANSSPGTAADSVVTVDGTQTLTNKTIGAGTLILAENASVALDPAGSADGKYTGITIAGTAGTTLAFGDLVYLAAADSRWELADADAASTSGDVPLAMCVLAAAADGDPTVLLVVGTIRADAAFPALTIGAPAYVSTTAGDIQVAQPSGTDDVIRRVGFALTADELLFNPSADYVTHI